jgi:hypothetical protein
MLVAESRSADPKQIQLPRSVPQTNQPDRNRLPVRSGAKVIDGRDGEMTTNTDGSSAILDVLLETWNDVSRLQREQLDAITLADLLEKASLRSEDMYYI